MKKTYQNGISENVRIRHYIMGLIYRSGGKSLRIPTSEKLAKEFGIARSTVLAALKQLREEGFLIGRRGSGVFTNGEILPVFSKKLIGLILAGGDHYYYGHAAWTALAEIGKALTNFDWNIRILSVNLNSLREMKIYFEKQSLSALVMIHTSSDHAHKAAEVLPTILIGHQRNETMPSIRFSYDKALRELRKATHFQRPLFLGEQHWMIENNFLPFWTGRRIPQSRRPASPLPGTHDFLDKLNTLLEKENPDLLFALPETAQELYLALQKLKKDIPIASWRTLPEAADFHGYVFKEPCKEAAERTVHLLQEQFQSGKMTPGAQELEVQLLRI